MRLPRFRRRPIPWRPLSSAEISRLISPYLCKRP